MPAAARLSPTRWFRAPRLAALLLLLPLTALAVPADVVLLLDNSGSMKKNDPQALAPKAVQSFLAKMNDGDRVAVVLFDEKVSLAQELTALGPDTRLTLGGALKGFTYTGKFTNMADGLERALYELKLHGRPEAEKSIVLLTDGVMDTGRKELDLEKIRWMREELAAEAKEKKVRIFGVAFTEGADYQLMQSLAQRTGAEYFRAMKPGDLEAMLLQVQQATATAQTLPEPPKPAEPPPPPREIIKEIIKEVPVQAPPPPPPPPPDRTPMYLGFGGVAVLLALLMLVLLRKGRNGGATVKEESIPAAELLDMERVSGTDKIDLSGGKITVLGRVAGKKDPNVRFVVIDKTSISRRHAIVEFKNHGYWVSDQNSGNGTFVNGQRLTAEMQLKHGDRISLDKFTFVFSMPEMEESDATVVQGSQRRASVPSSPPPRPAAAAAAPLNDDDDDAAPTSMPVHAKPHAHAHAPAPVRAPEPPPAPAAEVDSDWANLFEEDAPEAPPPPARKPPATDATPVAVKPAPAAPAPAKKVEEEFSDLAQEIASWSFETGQYNAEDYMKEVNKMKKGSEDMTQFPDEEGKKK